jgi:hypothetical protein
VLAVGELEDFREEAIDRLAGQFAGRVPEEVLRLAVGEDDPALGILTTIASGADATIAPASVPAPARSSDTGSSAAGGVPARCLVEPFGAVRSDGGAVPVIVSLLARRREAQGYFAYFSGRRAWPIGPALLVC